MAHHGRLISVADAGCLDSIQLEQLEHAFRDWADEAKRADLRLSRKRVLLIFLLVRYTGAKLHEVLALNPAHALDSKNLLIVFEKREVPLARHVALAMQTLLRELAGAALRRVRVDPAFVRRKFYERATACGFSKKQGSPEMIRKARAVELMQDNLPVPAVQRMLGHSSPHLTTAGIAFSEDDMRRVTRWHMERESGRKTSARNRFFGKVQSLIKGEVQSLVQLATLDGGALSAIVTNTSAEHLGLKPGRLLSAEVKAPWLVLERHNAKGCSSLENRRDGIIVRIKAGAVNTECAVRITDGVQLCAVVSSPAFAALRLKEGDPARVLFSSYAVILHTE
ncbi:MAG: TOBE domain-containing protein [Deltaproteobacteria bacterium]|jgi:molybdate transport system regulatory protein|nr:TOBE domain-containing protein [Deltaproteobacteria bacterium]